MTPAPTPPAPPALAPSDVSWADATSAIADIAMAAGAFLSVILLFLTFRAQARTLGLQQKQIDDIDERREQDRISSANHRRDLQKRRAGDARVELHQLHPEPATYLHQAEKTRAQRILDMVREAAGPDLESACAIGISSQGSGQALYNVNTYGQLLRRPDYVWRSTSKIVVRQHELDQIPQGDSATFIWVNMQIRELEEKGVEIRFSDEEGGRWGKSPHAQVVRIDDPAN